MCSLQKSWHFISLICSCISTLPGFKARPSLPLDHCAPYRDSKALFVIDAIIFPVLSQWVRSIANCMSVIQNLRVTLKFQYPKEEKSPKSSKTYTITKQDKQKTSDQDFWTEEPRSSSTESIFNYLSKSWIFHNNWGYQEFRVITSLAKTRFHFRTLEGSWFWKLVLHAKLL